MKLYTDCYSVLAALRKTGTASTLELARQFGTSTYRMTSKLAYLAKLGKVTKLKPGERGGNRYPAIWKANEKTPL